MTFGYEVFLLTSAVPWSIETLGEAILNLSGQIDLPITLETSHYLFIIHYNIALPRLGNIKEYGGQHNTVFTCIKVDNCIISITSLKLSLIS